MLARKLAGYGLVAAFMLTMVAGGRRVAARHSPRPGATPLTSRTKSSVRRALLVGIDNYEHDPEYQPQRCQEATPRKPAPRRQPNTAKGGFNSLEGPLDDVCELRKLLVAAYGFEDQNIHLLLDQEATHDGILSAFKRYLIDAADPGGGDVSLFFYSGHGAQWRNSLGGEADQLDETIVPYDWTRDIHKRSDVKDIRDKELFKLFKEASQKTILTALFDSCHSGDIARGGVGGERSKTGPAELDFDLKEPPPDDEQKGIAEDQYLENHGVLVISAARDFEEAKEKEYDGKWRGNFSYALSRVLQSPNAKNLSAARIFEKLLVEMKSSKASHEPVIVGSTIRRQETLFGEQVDTDKRPEVVVESVDQNGRITLQGGLAQGFHQNCEFVGKTSRGSVRIRIVAEPDFVRSVAEVVATTTAEAKRAAIIIKPNDTFVLDKWSIAGAPDLRVWMPAAKLTVAQIKVAAGEIEKLGESGQVQLVGDPTAALATHFLFYDGANWLLRMPDGQNLNIGANLTAATVLERLPKSGEKARLFATVPPAAELAGQIKLGPSTGNNAVAWANNPQDADYWLVGRQRADTAAPILEYAWLLPEATIGFAKAGDPNNARLRGANGAVSPLPPITGWRTTAADLQNIALRLSKIRGWTKLDSPQGESGRFAYRLVLTNSAGDLLSGDKSTLTEGDIFRLSLVADETRLQPPVEQRHVYVLSIDQYGKSELMYPDIEHGSADAPVPFVPESGRIPQEIPLGRVRVCGPDPKKGGCQSPGILGAETYIMLTTQDKLPDPTVLESDGVRTAEDLARDRNMKGVRGGDSALAQLLGSIGTTSRSGENAVPLNWSVQHVFLRSIEKQP